MKFEYNGHTAEEYGVIVTKLEDNKMGLSREIIKGEKTKFRTRSNHYGTKYSDDISFSIKIIKNICNAPQSKMAFTASDMRKINAWLTSPQYPEKLILTDSYYDEDIEYYALINNLTVEPDDYLYELTYEVITDSPFGLSPKFTHNIISTSDTTTEITINNTSDELEHFLYPVFTINPTEHGEITITNVTDDNRSMTFSVLRNNIITIDSQNRKFVDDIGTLITFEDIGITDVDQIKFPRFLHGENVFQITGAAEITISYQEPRKVGVF